MNIKKPTLIDNWKSCLKMYSVQMMTLALTVQGVWASMPDDMRASVPSGIISAITIGCLVLGVIGRLVQQGEKNVT